MNHRLISNPTFFEGEAELINELFSLGLPCLHLRKPDATDLECKELLEKIKPAHYNKIILHQQPNLLQDFSLMGWHVKEGLREGKSPAEITQLVNDYHQKGFVVGTSIHQPASLKLLYNKFDYAFLSPIFPSISKKDYLPSVEWKVDPSKYPFQLIALGGIKADNLAEVHKKGFEEVAFLGAVWENFSKAIAEYKKLLLCLNNK